MRAGAFAVIFDQQRRVLLCHRRDVDAWNLPGGGVEDGESPWDAVLREVREEVGVESEVVRLTGLYWKPDMSVLVFNFECRIVAGIPTTSDEADDVGFFAVDALPSNTAPQQVARIKDASAGIATAVLGVQTGLSSIELAVQRARS